MPIVYGTLVLTEADELGEYLSVMSGFDFDKIVTGSEQFLNRLFVRLSIIEDKRKMDIAQSAYLEAVAPNKKVGKNTGIFAPDELFGGMSGDTNAINNSIDVANELDGQNRRKLNEKEML